MNVQVRSSAFLGTQNAVSQHIRPPFNLTFVIIMVRIIRSVMNASVSRSFRYFCAEAPGSSAAE